MRSPSRERARFCGGPASAARSTLCPGRCWSRSGSSSRPSGPSHLALEQLRNTMRIQPRATAQEALDVGPPRPLVVGVAVVPVELLALVHRAISKRDAVDRTHLVPALAAVDEDVFERFEVLRLGDLRIQLLA